MRRVIEIRPAFPGETSSLAAFQVAMARETEDLTLPPEVVERGVAAVFDDPGKGHYFVAVGGEGEDGEDGRLLGSLLVTPEWSDWRAGTWWWIQSVYVVPEARGRGVYRALYEFVRNVVEADPGLVGLRLYVDQTNERAQAVYERLGMSRDHYQMFCWQKGLPGEGCMAVTASNPSVIPSVPPELPPLFSHLPEVLAQRYDPTAPWDLLGSSLDEILAAIGDDGIEAIEIRPLPEVHLAGDKIAIGRGTRIAPHVVIEGPAWIGCDVEIRPGAYIRGGCYIGDGAVVGANTELKRAILLPGAKAPHLNYVGDSILGAEVNLGAGTILSNFRHDGKEIRIAASPGWIATGRRKLGAILGDAVQTGCNCVLHPGSLVGAGTQIYPGVQLRSGIYPGNSLVKLRQETEVVPLEP